MSDENEKKFIKGQGVFFTGEFGSTNMTQGDKKHIISGNEVSVDICRQWSKRIGREQVCLHVMLKSGRTNEVVHMNVMLHPAAFREELGRFDEMMGEKFENSEGE